MSPQFSAASVHPNTNPNAVNTSGRLSSHRVFHERNCLIAGAPATVGSIDIVIGEIDR
jgi:hypothetical protein